jgi:hypothetical protein
MDAAGRFDGKRLQLTALFQQLVGGKLSRRQTIAGGAGECVCHIAPADAPPSDPREA